MGPWSLIDLFVLVGVGVVLPLAMPSRGWWLATAAAVALALALPVGPLAAALVLPWLAAGALATAGAWRRAWRRAWLGVGEPEVLAAGYAVVAAGALLQSRLGRELFGIGEPIVELTAVHFTYAGAGALTLARWNLVWGSGALARAAVLLTAVAPPVVAVGFVTGAAMPQVGGAVLMTAGIWMTSLLHLAAARDPWSSTAGRLLLGVSGVAPWAPMVLAVMWAAAQHADLPALSVDDMVRVHGTMNALGFVICGLVGWRLRMGSRREIGELVP